LATNGTSKPILFVDVDGVVSVFGFAEGSDPPGRFQWIDGIAHCILPEAGERLNRLAERFELVWATGWEERANEHLPFLLDLDGDELPWLRFDGGAVFGSAHWKLDAIGAYAGDRPAAWIDDNLDQECEAWAAGREAPTLLVKTESAVGISEEHTEQLLAWADEVAPHSAGEAA
jgi:Swiss Army Knife RNA repair-like protein